MWRSWVRRGLLVLSAVLAVSLVYLLVTRTESVPRSVNSGALAHVDAGIDQFSFMQSKGGTVQWHVEAQRARMTEAEHQAILEDVHVTLYGQKGGSLSYLEMKEPLTRPGKILRCFVAMGQSQSIYKTGTPSTPIISIGKKSGER
jgi:hypothetical protein